MGDGSVISRLLILDVVDIAEQLCHLRLYTLLEGRGFVAVLAVGTVVAVTCGSVARCCDPIAAERSASRDLFTKVAALVAYRSIFI